MKKNCLRWYPYVHFFSSRCLVEIWFPLESLEWRKKNQIKDLLYKSIILLKLVLYFNRLDDVRICKIGVSTNFVYIF